MTTTRSKKDKKRASAFVIGTAIAIWALFGCSAGGSQAPVTSAVASAVPSATQVQTPDQQWNAWKAGPGGAAFKKLLGDFGGQSFSDLSPVQIRHMLKEVKTAEAYPIPASIDSGGYYDDALSHFRKGVIQLQNANAFVAITHMQLALTSVKHLKTEIEKVTS